MSVDEAQAEHWRTTISAIKPAADQFAVGLAALADVADSMDWHARVKIYKGIRALLTRKTIARHEGAIYRIGISDITAVCGNVRDLEAMLPILRESLRGIADYLDGDA